MMSIDLIGYLAATLTTVAFLPQAILTLKTRDTESLSLSMYSLLTAGIVCWLIYGLGKDDKALIFANAITLTLASPILTIKIFNTLKQGRQG